jgi:hypothetical protein
MDRVLEGMNGRSVLNRLLPINIKQLFGVPLSVFFEDGPVIIVVEYKRKKRKIPKKERRKKEKEGIY